MTDYVIITYVNADGVVIPAAVSKTHGLFDDTSPYYPDNFTTLRFTDEGITWLRGYHTRNSKEVATLLVSRALAEKAA